MKIYNGNVKKGKREKDRCEGCGKNNERKIKGTWSFRLIKTKEKRWELEGVRGGKGECGGGGSDETGKRER